MELNPGYRSFHFHFWSCVFVCMHVHLCSSIAEKMNETSNSSLRPRILYFLIRYQVGKSVWGIPISIWPQAVRLAPFCGSAAWFVRLKV